MDTNAAGQESGYRLALPGWAKFGWLVAKEGGGVQPG